MVRYLMLLALVVALGCSSADRISTVVVPEDGGGTEYSEFLPRLRTLAWRATEAFYRDRWDELDDAVQTLDRAVTVLRQTKNVPARVQPSLANTCQALSQQCSKVREAARQQNAAAASDHLQKIHVMIRELRSEG